MDIRLMMKKLITSVSVVTLMIALVSGEEYCEDEIFTPSCSTSEVIIINKAKYGRMQVGRCVNRDWGYLGCIGDVLQVADNLCSGRSSCEISGSSTQLKTTANCPADLKQYLDISYTCQQIYSPQRRQCISPETINVETKGSYFASITAKDTSCGLHTSPLIISTKPGQKVSLELIDFAWKNNSRSGTRNCPQKYGYILDMESDDVFNICGGNAREHVPYVSTGQTVQVILESSQLHNHFLIKYTAVGCPDIVLPNSWKKVTNNSVTVGCQTSDDTWRLVCLKNIWLGIVGTCPEPTTAEGEIRLDDKHKVIPDNSGSYLPPVSHNHVVAVALGCITLLICLCVVMLGVFCTKRYAVKITKFKQQIQTNHYVTTNLSTVNRNTSLYKPVIVGYRQQATLPLHNDSYRQQATLPLRNDSYSQQATLPLCTIPRAHSVIPPSIPKIPPSCRMSRSTDDLIFMGDDRDSVKFYVTENPRVIRDSKIYQSIQRGHSNSN